ncbi:ABC transporter [Sulfolobales archaeon HS-7]|nr:ABC transporter [Sulfolobales archaeon HS-7]
MRRVLLTAKAFILDNLRSRFTIFWIVIFPVVIFLLFLLIFGNMSTFSYHVYVLGTNASTIVRELNALNIPSSVGRVNLNQEPGILVIVNNSQIEVNYSTGLKLQAAGIYSYVKCLKLNKTPPISIGGKFSTGKYIATGMLGIIALTNGVFGIVGVASGYYRDGLTIRLASSPLSNIEWVLSYVIYELVITALSTLALLIFSAILGILPSLSPILILALLLGTIMFAGIGEFIFGLTPKDRIFIGESIATVLIFPLMFLSNSFYATSNFPIVVSTALQYMPVSAVNSIIRFSVFGGPFPTISLLEVVIIATIFILLGSKSMRLREV